MARANERKMHAAGVLAALRRWSLSVAAMGVLVAGLVATINLVIDPYQVFHLVHWRASYSPNEWHNKFARVLADPGRFDSFLVGSSRMGLYDPKQAERLFPGSRFYNLSKFASEPSENLRALQALAAAGVDIERVLVGIDLYPFLAARAEGDPAHFPPPPLTGAARWAFLSDYLFLSSFYPCGLRLLHHWADQPEIRFDFATGECFLPGRERALRADPQAFVRRQFARPPAPLGEVRFRASELAALRALRDWASANGTQIEFLIHPHHPALRAQIGEEAFAAFVDRVRESVGAVQDFSTALDGEGDAAYYDFKHFRRTHARQVLEAVGGDRSERSVGNALPRRAQTK